ncbi:MAG: hypothetical protein N2037_00440 [Acidimicrobiales bacterium]|nr:hypothetical protein [Acidimicrobiales bacterium]
MSAASASFDEIVATVQSRAPYLRCAHLDPGLIDDGWIRVSDLLGNDSLLESHIASTGDARGAPDAAVAASLFVQAFAFRVPSMAVAAWALGLPSTTLEPDQLVMRITRNRPGEVGVLSTSTRSHDAGSLAAAVVDGLIEPLVCAVRRKIKVGERLLYGNTVSSLAVVFRAMQSNGPAGDRMVRDRGEQMLTAHPRLRRLGRWQLLETPGAIGWYWDRGNCCLWYRTAEAAGRYCEDCSLVDPVEREKRRRVELAAGAGAADR